MKTISLTLYTAQELKDQFPEAFEKAHRDYAAKCCNDEVPWQNEIFDSLARIIKATGFNLRDWSLGPSWNQGNRLSVSSSYEHEELAGKKALAFFAQVLTSHGYSRPTFPGWNVEFPGICGFTGVCFDDDYCDQVWRDLKRGETLKDALENMAHTYGKLLDAEIAQAESEDEFLNQADFLEWQFTEDGERY